MNAETPEVAPNAESTRRLQGAQTDEADARAFSLAHPQDEFEYQQTDHGLLAINKRTQAVTPVTLNGQAVGRPVADKPDTPEQQYLDEYQKAHPGSTIAQAEKQFKADTQTPQRAPIVQMFMPDPNHPGNSILTPVHPGQSIGPGAQTPSGLNSSNTPTSQTRNMAEMATTVLPMMDNVSKQVDQMASSLGPAVGRWNDLMVNKGGKDFPQFANLDTNLDLLASAIVRTHFGARGGQQYREELRKMFGAAQSPEDLKARIAGAGQWIEGYAHMADRGDANGGGHPPRPANVPAGYEFNQNGSQGAGWYKPKGKQ
jgi:hypothetical protein